MKKGSLFSEKPESLSGERFDTLIVAEEFRLERILSRSHATPEGEWYDQDWAEWVLLVKGSAGLRIDGEPDVTVLMPGDYVYLPERLRHRVEWTDPQAETIWLALHYAA